MYGCGAGKQADAKTRLKAYRHEGRWDRALATMDIETTTTATPSNQLLLLQVFTNH